MAELRGTHTAIHLLFGTLPLLTAAVVAWYMHARGSAPSLAEIIIIPVISGLVGLAVTILAYLGFLYTSRVPRLLWEEGQRSLATEANRHEEAAKKSQDREARLQESVDLLTIQFTEQRRLNRLAALTAELDFKFGPTSGVSPAQRVEMATDYFEKLERELIANDFTHEVEFLAARETIRSTLSDCYKSGPQYAAWHERFVKVLEAVSRHQED
jgi:hypothetical protein